MSLQKLLPAPVETVRYTIQALGNLVEPLRQRFIATISNGELTDAEVGQWELVFQELLVNAIKHGALNDPAQSVSIEWSITHNAIVLAAQDPGQGPTDTMLQSPSLPDDPLSESGRGLYIIAAGTDERRWWRGPHGFRLEVLKYYPTQGLPLLSNPELDDVLDELSACYESLSVFHRLTGSLIESGNLRDFIGGSLDEFIGLHPLDWIFFQGSPTIPETIHKVLSTASWFLDQHAADPTLRTLGALTSETVWETPDDLVRQGIDILPLRSVGAGCVFPIIAGGNHFGALIALRKPAITESRSRSLGTLRTLADLCGIACANAHLANIRDESQKDLRELEIAVEIQKALLPILPAPVSKRWRVSIYQESSLSIAGDYAIAKTDAAGNLVIAMIDVMGKGVSAALLASIFRTAFDLSLHNSSANGILETINNTLCDQLGNLTMFITCAVARVTADGKFIEHANAGHCPTFFFGADGTRRFLEPSGPPIGILAAISYTSDRIALEGGERFVFVTDGCYEWARHDEDSGWQSFVSQIDQHRSAAPQDLWNGLRARINDQYGPSLEDDCTLITLDIPK
jgi:serine phosphatase RsbU (regulator of sigma subunit)/anti-sigma regulatory factor (Ser/Thr protein kinase)